MNTIKNILLDSESNLDSSQNHNPSTTYVKPENLYLNKNRNDNICCRAIIIQA